MSINQSTNTYWHLTRFEYAKYFLDAATLILHIQWITLLKSTYVRLVKGPLLDYRLHHGLLA